MTTPDLVVVANASAGTADRSVIEDACATWSETTSVDLVWTESPEAVDAVVARLGDQRLVIAGGDGSVHAVVNALVGADRLDVEIAILPLGTGNDTAGGLGLDLDGAIRAATGTTIRCLDLISTDVGVVVNALHLGIGADAAHRASGLKDRLGALAYPVGAILAGVRSSRWHARVTVDGTEIADGPHSLIALGNGHRVGGGFELAPGAEHDDRTIEVVAVPEHRWTDRLRFGVAAARDRHTALDDVVTCSGREVEITCDPVRANLDGELVDEVRRLTATLRPGVLRWCSPQN